MLQQTVNAQEMRKNTLYKEDHKTFEADIQTNFNCLMRPTLLSRIFGYNPQTFRNWEPDKHIDGKGPLLHPVIQDETKTRTRRLYTSKDVIEIYKYIESQGEIIPRVDKTKTIAVWNNKGGVGKSVFAANIAAVMSSLMGLKVLLIDTDSQKDLTWITGCLESKEDEVLKKGATLRHIVGFIEVDDNKNEKEIIMPFDKAKVSLSPTLDLLQADDDLNELDFDFSYLEGLYSNEKGHDVSRVANIKERFLNEHILGKTDYDVVIFDCAPNKSLLNVNILYAVDQLIVPVAVGAKSEHSMKNVEKFLTKLNNLNDGFSFDDIKAVLNMIDTRENIKLDGIDKLEKKYQKSILSSAYFAKSTVVDQAENKKEPIFQRASDTKKDRSVPLSKRLSNAFWDLSHEVLNIKPKTSLFPEVLY
jgi:cellulose biosynthesis protein BcsQ